MTRMLPLALALALAAPGLPMAAAPGQAFPVAGTGGKAMGGIILTEGPTGVMLRLELTGLTPGWHAIHFHEKADCSDAAFASAEAHINHATAKKPHGLLNPDGPDMGDLANIYAGADGGAHAEVFSALVSLKGRRRPPGPAGRRRLGPDRPRQPGRRRHPADRRRRRARRLRRDPLARRYFTLSRKSMMSLRFAASGTFDRHRTSPARTWPGRSGKCRGWRGPR